jgi:type I restriction enzyme, S subunit
LTLPIVQLGDVADFVNGFAFKPEDWSSKGLPIIRIQNLTGSGSTINRTNLPVPAKYRAVQGDLLVSWSASLGVFRWDGPEAVVNQHIFKVVPNLEKVDLDYLRHAIDSSIHEMERFTHGSTMKHINRKEFLEHRIPLPHLDDQRRIAAILDKADALRRTRKRAHDLLGGLTDSIFFEMFGDLVSNSKGWNEIQALGHLADIASGITKGRKLNGEATREIPYLAVSNVQDKFLDLSIVKTIHASENEIKRYRLTKNDLLLTEGGDPDKLGRGTLWADELGEAIHQNHIFRVRVHSQRAMPTYLVWLLGSPYGKAYFLRSAKQTTGIASINKRQLSDFPVILPPVVLQAEFEKRAYSARRITQTNSLNNIGIDVLFSSLQHRAFSGQL